uniref:Variant surface glycoprotein n=1 Tax=Trypanosoma brucei TaxID=5691 RepID=A0A1V0FZL5_9TRYP|nr:variant surface glycoprotein [Trypanosoma brucei]
MTKAAIKLRKEVKNKISQVTTLRQEARDAMARALYATDNPSTDAVTDPNTKLPDIAASKFPWKANADRDTMCATAADDGSKAGKSLETDMVCLCVQHDGATNDFCGSNLGLATTAITGNSAQATAAAAFKQLATSCAATLETSQQKLLEHALTAAVQTIFANLGKNYVKQASATGAAYSPSNQGMLGKYVIGTTTAGACTSASLNSFGTAGKGVCIGYHDVLKTNKPIPCVKEVNIAVRKLNAVSDLFSQATSTLAQVKMIEQKMEAFLWIGDLLNPMTRTLQQIPTNKQPTVEEHNKCAKFNSNETDCPQIIANMVIKKCKAKTLVEAAQGTKEQAGGVK